MNLEEIKKEIVNNGGITLNNKLEKMNFKKGYIISFNKYEIIIKDLDDLEKAIKKQLERIGDKKLLIGIWHYDNQYYIDINILKYDKIEALEKGKKEKQLAIWSNEEEKEIFLKNYNFIETFTLYNRKKELITQFDSIDKMLDFINEEIFIKNKKIVNNNRFKEEREEKEKLIKIVSKKTLLNRISDNSILRDLFYIKKDYLLMEE